MIPRPRLGGFAGRPYADEHHALESYLTVFDFGDVLLLAETRHMLQRIAGFTLLPLFIVGFVETRPRRPVSSSTSDWSASTPPMVGSSVFCSISISWVNGTSHG